MKQGMNERRMKKCHHSFKSCRRSQYKTIFSELIEEGKIILEHGEVIEIRTQQL